MGNLQKEGACIYPMDDSRYKNTWVKINPIIDQELVKHKIIIEGRYKQSVMNSGYVFPKTFQAKRKYQN